MTCPGGLVPASHLSSSAATAESGAPRVVGSLEAAGLELVVARSERCLVGHRLAQLGEVRVVVGVGLDIRQNVDRLGRRAILRGLVVEQAARSEEHKSELQVTN